MITLTTNEKHLCLPMLLYGAGMRLSEAIALKPTFGGQAPSTWTRNA